MNLKIHGLGGFLSQPPWLSSEPPDISSVIPVATNLDPNVIQELRQFAKEGESNGHNPCLDGTYEDNKKEYMENPATYRWIIMSEDISVNRVPRYPIPTMKSAFQVEPIKSNGYCNAILRVVEEANPFPNGKIPELHKDMSTGILKELEKP
jgi:hypothetical protein